MGITIYVSSISAVSEVEMVRKFVLCTVEDAFLQFPYYETKSFLSQRKRLFPRRTDYSMKISSSARTIESVIEGNSFANNFVR